jgi:molybdenum cofactor biosynthesis protein MoaC
MRDVTHKIDTLRTAVARAELRAHPDTLRMIREGQVPKGDPLSVAKVAAVQAAKSTPAIIPYCHPVPLTFVGVEFELGERSITVTCTVKALYKTGVEMEALTAVAAAVLNLYDMLKMLDEEMEIVGVRLLSKTGGKSDFVLGVEGIHAAVLVVSDSVSQARSEDLSGARLVERLRELGLSVSGPDVVSDEAATIADWVRRTCDSGTARLVVLTGGTGIGPRDVTPEAMPFEPLAKSAPLTRCSAGAWPGFGGTLWCCAFRARRRALKTPCARSFRTSCMRSGSSMAPSTTSNQLEGRRADRFCRGLGSDSQRGPAPGPGVRRSATLVRPRFS